MTKRILASLATLILCVHCGSGSDSGKTNGGPGPAGIEGAHGACAGATDCAATEICLAAPGGGGACVPTCSVNGGECSGTASCAGVATLSVNVCKSENSSPSASDEASSDDVQVPCHSDAECQALDQGALCVADVHGDRQCAEACTTEADCNVPGLAGYSVDFFSCQTDRANTSRTACLFDPKCESDPLSCTTGFTGIGTGGAPGGGTGGSPGLGGEPGFGGDPGFGFGGDPTDPGFP